MKNIHQGIITKKTIDKKQYQNNNYERTLRNNQEQCPEIIIQNIQN